MITRAQFVFASILMLLCVGTVSAQTAEPSTMPAPTDSYYQNGSYPPPPPPPPPSPDGATYYRSEPNTSSGYSYPPQDQYPHPKDGDVPMGAPVYEKRMMDEGEDGSVRTFSGSRSDERMPPSTDSRREGSSQNQFQDRGQFDQSGEDTMDAERLASMKRGMRGMEQGLTRLKKVIERLKAKGIAVPATDEEAIATLSTAFATIKDATEFSDTVESAMETLSESGESMQEIGMRLGMLEQLPKITKEAEKRIKQARAKLVKAKTRAEKAGINVSEIVTRVETALASIESSVQAMKTQTGDDLEEAMESLRENAFEAMEDIASDIRLLENISNSAKIIKEAKREISRIEKLATQLKKQNKDTARLFELITEMKATLAETETAIAENSDDPEALFEIMSEGESLHNDALEELANLRGDETDIDKQFKVSDPTKTSSVGAAVINTLDLLRGLFN